MEKVLVSFAKPQQDGKYIFEYKPGRLVRFVVLPNQFGSDLKAIVNLDDGSFIAVGIGDIKTYSVDEIKCKI